MKLTEINNPETWNEGVVAYPHTFLHTWEWGQLQKKSGEDVKYIEIKDKHGARSGLMLLLTVNAKRGRHLFCPHGPLFANDSLARENLPELITAIKEKFGQDMAALRIAPLLKNTEENITLFKSLGFRDAPLHVHSELTWLLDIKNDEETLLANMRKTTRHAIRRAEKAGVETEIVTGTDILKRFLPLYEATRQRHNFVAFSETFLRNQIELFSKNNMLFSVVARYEGKDVAAAICVHFGSFVYYHHGASTKLPSRIPAAQAVQWAAIQEARRRGAATYNFWGIAPDNEPKHPFAGITTFKKGFGGYELDLMHAQDLPLSLRYWPMNAIERYRKWRRGF